MRPGSCACRASSSNNGNGTGAGGTSFDDDAASGLGKLRFNKRASELPPELRDLEIRETKDGSVLVDSTTGKVINDFGATRFDVAVRALRGELDPPSWTEVRCCVHHTSVGLLSGVSAVLCFADGVAVVVGGGGAASLCDCDAKKTQQVVVLRRAPHLTACAVSCMLSRCCTPLPLSPYNKKHNTKNRTRNATQVYCSPSW